MSLSLWLEVKSVPPVFCQESINSARKETTYNNNSFANSTRSAFEIRGN